MSRVKWIVASVVLLSALLGAGWMIRAAIEAPGKVARKLSDALEERLHARPTVYLRRTVVVEEKKPIAELALVSRATDVEHRMDSELLFSKAQLAMRAAYVVKAGFDLRSPHFAVRLDTTLRKARLELPSPRVLSVEMTRYDVIEDRSGWWNRVTKEDRTMALRQMQADAKLEAIRAGILQECRQELEQKLVDISARTGVELEYRYLLGSDSTVMIPMDSAATLR